MQSLKSYMVELVPPDVTRPTQTNLQVHPDSPKVCPMSTKDRQTGGNAKSNTQAPKKAQPKSELKMYMVLLQTQSDYN